MKIVNLSRDRTCTHYCGRISSYNVRQHGMYMDLGNPFHVTADTPREKAVEFFERWARSMPDVMARIKALPKHAVLGCWCKPLDCHVDVIMKIWNELNQGDKP